MTQRGTAVLTEMPIVFDGDWAVRVDANRVWSGSARTKRPFVALVVAQREGQLLWAKTEVCQSPASITLNLHPLRDPTHIQPILIVGNGYLQEVTVHLRSPMDAVRSILPKSGRAGALEGAFLIPSDPETRFSLLFLAREDVRVGRTGVWRPRTIMDGLLPCMLAAVLAGGRKGLIDVGAKREAI